MGIGKAFKKAGKKLKKGTKKATGAVKDAADKVADGAKQGADAAGSALERAGEQAGALAESAYDEALQLGESAWNETLTALERWLEDGLVDLLIDAAMATVRGQKALIDAMVAGGTALLADAKGAADFERMITAAAGKQRDAATLASVKALARRPELQVIADTCGKFAMLSLGGGGSAAYGAGAEGCFGYACSLPDAAAIGGFFGVGGVANSVGASLADQLGVWTPRPADLKGPYFAVTVEVTVGPGAGLQVVFAVPDDEAGWLALVSGKTTPAPVGIVVSFSGGAELSASVSGGYTWVF